LTSLTQHLLTAPTPLHSRYSRKTNWWRWSYMWLQFLCFVL
jgi:hypothetical protein